MRTIVPHEQQVLQNEIAKALRDEKVPRERRRIAASDKEALLRLDIRQVLTNAIEIFDDRREHAHLIFLNTHRLRHHAFELCHIVFHILR